MALGETRIAFERLHALARRGYSPRLGTLNRMGDDAAIELVHPRNHVGRDPAPTLTLCANGRVLPDGFSATFGPEDTEAFARFLRSVRLPSFYDRHLRHLVVTAKIIALLYGLNLLILFGIGLAVATLFPDQSFDPWLIALVPTLPYALAAALQPKYG